jgi:hypothetical protein
MRCSLSLLWLGRARLGLFGLGLRRTKEISETSRRLRKHHSYAGSSKKVRIETSDSLSTPPSCSTGIACALDSAWVVTLVAAGTVAPATELDASCDASWEKT